MMAGRVRPRAGGLERRLEFEELVSELSSRFINLPPGEVDREIEDALRRVCEFLAIDHALLWQWSAGAPPVATPTHSYLAQGVPQPPEPSTQEQYPWVASQMLAGRIAALPSLQALPAEAAVDRESARRLGIKSSLTLPLAVGGASPVGALAFNAMRTPRDWPETLVTRLQLVAGVFANALARRRADEALQESEERSALAVGSAEAGLWVLDYSTGRFWASERGRAIFGYAPDEAVEMERFQASVHPEDWRLVREAIEHSARNGEPVRLEYRIVLPADGGIRWIASRGRPRFSSTGEPERLLGLSIDVTERKRDEEALRESQARLEAGAELAGLGYYEVDYGNRTAFVDARTRDIVGVPPEREEGMQVVEFILERMDPDDRKRVLERRELLLEGRLDRASVEFRFLHPTRGERWLDLISCAATRDAEGRVQRVHGVIRDNTEVRQREEALRQSLAEIERLKDRLQAESDYLKAEIRAIHPHGEITGRSAAITRVLRQIEQVAPTDSMVLLYGETGTGKELVAQAIHRLSLRGSRLMVKVNCAALPSGLVESELFGREKGAYTGALTRQAGRFEVADGSTLFLDEVGELALDVQAKLLRVLEAGEFERLGSPRTLAVDVRVIAATHRDLAGDVREGRFREDLYYRLNVFPILVPPLRERIEDIPQLVWAMLEEFSSRMGKKITKVPRRTMDALQQHPWPGNVRELRNVIEHAAIVTEGDVLRVHVLEEAPGATAPARTLADSERDFIQKALERTRGRIKGPEGAAVQLGLRPSTLYGRMRKLGIRRPGQEGKSTD